MLLIKGKAVHILLRHDILHALVIAHTDLIDFVVIEVKSDAQKLDFFPLGGCGARCLSLWFLALGFLICRFLLWGKSCQFVTNR